MKNGQIILLLVIIILIVAFWKQIKAFFMPAAMAPALVEGAACTVQPIGNLDTPSLYIPGTIRNGVCVANLAERTVIYENQNPNQPFLYRMVNGRIIRVIQG